MLRFFIVVFVFLSPFFLKTSLGQWTQLGGDVIGESVGDLSGSAISISSDGKTLVVGAFANQDIGNHSGSVRIYEWNGFAWLQKGLEVNGESAFENFGWSVSLSGDGNSFIVGAYGAGSTNGGSSGHAKVYYWDNTSWVQKGQTLIGDASGDFFGSSVEMSIDGNSVVIGAPRNDVNGGSSGQAIVYYWDNTSWVQKGSKLYGGGVGLYFGQSVSFSQDANTLVVGGPGYVTLNSVSGYVKVFSWDGTNWVNKGNSIEGEYGGDMFGSAVSLSLDGETVAVGAYKNDNVRENAGQVKVYKWTGTSWTQKGVTIDGQRLGENFGYSLDINGHGDFLIIGAMMNESMGYEAGQVSFFKWESSSWVLYGERINGRTANEYCGYSVAMTKDAAIVAIGSPGRDTTLTPNIGHVKVYEVEPLGVINVRNSRIQIYPNPASNMVKVDLKGMANTSLRVVDITGKVVFSMDNINMETYLLNVESWQGIYILDVRNEYVSQRLKLVIKRN